MGPWAVAGMRPFTGARHAQKRPMERARAIGSKQRSQMYIVSSTPSSAGASSALACCPAGPACRRALGVMLWLALVVASPAFAQQPIPTGEVRDPVHVEQRQEDEIRRFYAAAGMGFDFNRGRFDVRSASPQ